MKNPKKPYEITEDIMMQGVYIPHKNEMEYEYLNTLVKHKKYKRSKHPHFKGNTMLELSKNMKPTK